MLNSELLKLFSKYDSNLGGNSLMRTIRFNRQVFKDEEILKSSSGLNFFEKRDNSSTLGDILEQGLKAINRNGFYRIISDPVLRTTTNIKSGKEYPTWSAELLYCQFGDNEYKKSILNIGPLINRKARFADLNGTIIFDKAMSKESFFKQLKGITFYISRQITEQDSWGDVKQTDWLILPDSLFLYNFKMSEPGTILHDMLL